MEPSPKGRENAPAHLLFQHFASLAAPQMVLSLFLVLSGFYFARRREWARRALLMFTYLYVTWCVGFGAMWMETLFSLGPLDVLMVAMALGRMGFMIMFVGIGYLGIRFLRSKEVIEACHQ